MCPGLLPQIEIGVQNFVSWTFFRVHQAFRILEYFSLNILLGLRRFVAGNPALDNFINRKYVWCVLPLLFQSLLHFLVGLSERYLGIRFVVTGPRHCAAVSWA